jgi:hypothetical protein
MPRIRSKPLGFVGFPLQNLPELAISNVFSEIVNYPIKEAFKDLLSLNRTCKDFLKITDFEQLYKQVYDKLEVLPQHDTYMSELSYLKRLYLLLETGCQRCDTPNIKKIYWPKPMRICTKCFKEVTISLHSLRIKYRIEIDEKVFKPIFELETANQSLYLIKDVENLIECKIHEFSLNDYKRQLSIDLGIPAKELGIYSKLYFKVAKPNKNKVIKEYYTRLATTQFKKLKIVDKNMLYYKEYHELYEITTKLKYDVWFENFKTIKERLSKYTEYKKIYDDKIQDLNSLMRTYKFRKTICYSNYEIYNIDNIPEISEILSKYKEVNYPISELEDAMNQASEIIKTLIAKELHIAIMS